MVQGLQKQGPAGRNHPVWIVKSPDKAGRFFSLYLPARGE
jgi:hypothetical protein